MSRFSKILGSPSDTKTDALRDVTRERNWKGSLEDHAMALIHSDIEQMKEEDALRQAKRKANARAREAENVLLPLYEDGHPDPEPVMEPAVSESEEIVEHPGEDARTAVPTFVPKDRNEVVSEPVAYRYRAPAVDHLNDFRSRIARRHQDRLVLEISERDESSFYGRLEIHDLLEELFEVRIPATSFHEALSDFHGQFDGDGGKAWGEREEIHPLAQWGHALLPYPNKAQIRVLLTWGYKEDGSFQDPSGEEV